MLTGFATLVIVCVVFVVGLFLARRLLRLALKLAVVGAIIFALFVGGVFGWWRGWFSTLLDPQQSTTQPNQSRSPVRRATPR